MSGEERLSAEEMDEIRRKNMTYQYLCYLEEAKTLVSFNFEMKLLWFCISCILSKLKIDKGNKD